MVSWLRDDRYSLAVNGHLCCCVQGGLHLLRCHMDHPHRWPGFRLRFVLIMQGDKVLKLVMPSKQGQSCLPQGCIGSHGSQSEEVSSCPYVDAAQPGTIQKSFFLCSMKAHLIPSVSHGDRSWGHTRRGRRCCWRWGWWRQSRVCLFLSRRLGPSVPLRRRLEIVRVVWRSCLLLICCIAFSWFLLDIKKSEFWSGFQLCLPYKLLRCKTFLLPFELFLSYPRHPLTAWFEIKYIRQFIPAPLMA